VAPRDRDSSSGSQPNQNSALNITEIKALMDVMIEKGISEFELESAGMRIRIARQAAAASTQYAPAPTTHAAAPAPGSAQTAGGAQAPVTKPGQIGTAESEELHVVRAPIVGTYYASASPGSEAFVRVGDTIQAGQVLCIIEAMKLMNEIEAELAGEITKCYVENGQPVEYGEPLFDIRPSTPVKR
jgi:acetyl-CoA carboxylase biotin carboxyl carrier protein